MKIAIRTELYIVIETYFLLPDENRNTTAQSVNELLPDRPQLKNLTCNKTYIRSIATKII